MPMLDLSIPARALDAEAEDTLVDEATAILLAAEGADPTDPTARAMAKAFLHHPEVFVAGSRPDAPHYRIIASVPEGQLNGRERKQQLVAALTDAVLKAEGPSGDGDRGRVWVFPLEIPDGHWGAHGHALSLADILTAAIGDQDKARTAAHRRVTTSRAEKTDN